MSNEMKGKRITKKQYDKLMKLKFKQERMLADVRYSKKHPNPVINDLIQIRKSNDKLLNEMLNAKEVQLKSKDEIAKGFWIDLETNEYKKHGEGVIFHHNKTTIKRGIYAYK